jgi:hypothetical protein
MNFLAMILQSTHDTAPGREALLFIVPLVLIVCVIVLAIILVPFWFICKKAGFSPWLTLLNIVPFGGLVLVYVLAFAEWKVVPMAQLAPYPGGYPPVPPAYPPVPPTA